MNEVYKLVKVTNGLNSLLTVAKDTHEGWRETFAFLKEQGITIEDRKISDWMGGAVQSEELLHYLHGPEECPVKATTLDFMFN
jgi:hypothetical protein